MKSFDVELIKEKQKEYYKFICPICKNELIIGIHLPARLGFLECKNCGFVNLDDNRYIKRCNYDL